MTGNPNCTKCSSSNIIMNIWGYPDLEEVKKLKSLGYEVNLKGCLLPDVGEEFLYECKDCGNKFGAF